MTRTSSAATGAVPERRLPGPVPIHAHDEWHERFPWLVQGTTGRGDADAPFDLGLWGDEPAGDVLRRWRALRDTLAMPCAVHALQVHGTDVVVHEAGPPGLRVLDATDGHATGAAGVLLAVSVADCVPVFLVDPEPPAVAVLHAGWRGVAGGVLEAGVRTLAARWGTAPERLLMHTGPAICGECYEVGAEVHEALGLERPSGRRPVDLRAVLAEQARALGIAPEHTTTSAVCTREHDAFFSHRGGDAGRQMAVIGVRP